ncbi:MAG: hypothetical protein JOZ92_01340 [Candidatus Dormibacteraeota bacterium]|nr:hypothetical protein [Candidatus Dormibacteraeota bacterium]
MNSGAQLPLEACPHCGELVPPGRFCGNCGAHLIADADAARARYHAYAAGPHEPVLRPAIVTTLFPHLPHRHTHLFRDVLAAGVVVIALLCALRLFTSATVAAAVLLPVLYLLYLYEVEVYERAPLLVVGATFGVGAALGVAYALVVPVVVHPSVVVTAGSVLVSGVLLAAVAQLLMLVGPLLLLRRVEFDETLDGLTFGVSSALGFTMTVIIAGYWHVLTSPLSGGSVVDVILGLLQIGILGAFVNAATTALITSALWLRVHGHDRGRFHAAWHGLGAAALLAFVVQIVLGVLQRVLTIEVSAVIAWAVAAAVALVALRVVVHHALLDEGAERAIGPDSVCAECHHVVPTMLFCPVCGVARSAAPKRMSAASAPAATAEAAP